MNSNMICLNSFHTLWRELNQGTFPWVETSCGKMDSKHKLFMSVCEAVINISDFNYAVWKGNGRPPEARLNIFKAFLYKVTFNIPTTKDLIRILREEPLAHRLCGWSCGGMVSSEASFSRAFKEFAERGFTEERFADLIKKYLGDEEIDTISYDSAPIEVRAKAANMKKRLQMLDPDQPEPPSRLEIQAARSSQVNMAELPDECEWGCKRDSHGKKKQWKGGKLHVGVTKEGIPIAAKYTSASLHDSQVMIPLAQQVSERITHYFDLADAAYDAEPIREACAGLGTVAIIDSNPRKSNEPYRMSELEKKIYKDRSSVERYFSHHLDAHGGRMVRVRAPRKIALHLLLGTIVIAVEQLIRMIN